MLSLKQRITLHITTLKKCLLKTGWAPRSYTNDPPCRYIKNEIILDVMPESTNELLISNAWYKEGFLNKIKHKLSFGNEINIFPFAYFLASKITAFESRGNENYIEHKDMVDIFNLLASSTVQGEFEKMSGPVYDYVTNRLGHFLENPDFKFALHGHFSHDEGHIITNIEKVLDQNIGL